MTEAVKGKHFFLENDIKGPALKLDNTGKAIPNNPFYSYNIFKKQCISF